MVSMDFDVRDFLSNCRASKPPYKCPCGKTYKSLAGIQSHVNIAHLINSTNKKRILNTSNANQNNPMFYDEDSSNANFNSIGSVGKAREALTYAEAQRMIEVEIEGVIHRININEPMSLISLDPESNKSDKIALEGYKTPEIYSNHSEHTFFNNNSNHASSTLTNSSTCHLSSAKKSTKKNRTSSKTKESSMKSSSKNKSVNNRTNNSTTNHVNAQHQQLIKLPQPSFRVINNQQEICAPPRPISYYRFIDKSNEELDETVEYDMDEEDFSWLELMNKKRQKENLSLITPDTFELLMDRLEKECYFLNKTNANSDYSTSSFIENAVCSICNDGECQNSNAILFCDMCDLPVHQDCYGVPYIPEGQWLCRRCLQSPSRSVTCILCPNKGGAFKQTDDGRWCHVVCALWIPEVCFANTVFLEPIDNICAIPTARWKLICYICKEKNKGACIQCHKSNCYVAFHVTCAQQAHLHMRMEAVREFNSNGANTYIRKEAYCFAHMPGSGDSTNNLPSLEIHNGKHSSDEQSDVEESSFSEEDSQSNSNRKRSKKSLTNNHNSSSRTNIVSGNEKGANVKENNNFNEATLSQKRQIKAKMKKARRVLAEKRNACPTVSIPTIPAERLTEIAQLINVPKRNQFVSRLLGYWTLKRESRNGVPLLRRLQVSHANSRHKALTKNGENDEEHNNEHTMQLKAELKELFRLRQDLERARILIELVRRREKIKREAIRNLEQIMILQLNPFNIFLDSVLNQLKAKDVHSFFNEPVDTNEVHDYLQFIKNPMSFADMKRKIDNFEYNSFDDLERDFELIIDNCTTYNQKTTIYFKSAVKLRENCKPIFKQARQMINEIGFNEKKGIHNPEMSLDIGSSSRPFAQFVEDEHAQELTSKLSKLEDDLKETHMKKSGGTKSKRIKHLLGQIDKVKKELFDLKGSNSLTDNQDEASVWPIDDKESQHKSPRSGKSHGKSSARKSQQNGNKSDSLVYPVFNFKGNSKGNDKLESVSFNCITASANSNKRKSESNSKSNSKVKKSLSGSDINMKPITSYYQVLQSNSNADSFKAYRQKSNSSDSSASERESSSNSSFQSSSSSANTSSSSSSNS